jgi:Tfp pilus assembly protein PilN
MRPINLARQPFRNERLPNLGTGLLAALALLLCIPHGLLIVQAGPRHLARLETEVGSLEAEQKAAQAESRRLAGIQPTTEEAERASVVKDLVDRRLLRWTQLLADFERVLPADLKLVSLAPTLEDQTITLSLTVAAQRGNSASLIKLVDVLDHQPMFAHVVPQSIADSQDGVQASYTMTYRPLEPPVGTTETSTTPTPDAAPTPGAAQP